MVNRTGRDADFTRRSLGGQPSFTKQLADQNRSEQPSMKFRTYAPKGSKLASGYVDRTQARQEESDDREKRLKALEESLKNDEIDQETYDRLRSNIAGGDLESTHLVKGLDFKLLARIRQGEDVYSGKAKEASDDVEEAADVDDEFDELEDREVQAVEKEKTEKKKGQLSTVATTAGKKRSRDQILAEMKAARAAAKAQAEPALGDRFKKIGSTHKAGTRFERDSKGRELMIITDEDGHEKRKVRKLQPGQEPEPDMMPDANAKPLGMEVPEQYQKKEEPPEDSDSDIFADAGDDYDPLAGIGGSSSDDDSDTEKPAKDKTEGDAPSSSSMAPPPKPAQKQNYFKDSKTGLLSEEQTKNPSMSDPAIMAAIKRASALRPMGGDRDDDSDDEKASERKAREERHRQMLQNSSRDDEDMDMGFGTSRFEDEEDFDNKKTKLSRWGGGNDDDDGEGHAGGGKGKRKRAPKKRKGDVNNAADVLRVMEERKKA